MFRSNAYAFSKLGKQRKAQSWERGHCDCQSAVEALPHGRHDGRVDSLSIRCNGPSHPWHFEARTPPQLPIHASPYCKVLIAERIRLVRA